MSIVLRAAPFKNGQRVFPVAAGAVIAKGDIVTLDPNGALAPASLVPNGGAIGKTQSLISSNFVGIALVSSSASQTDPILVRVDGDFLADCVPGAYQVGDSLGCADSGDGSASSQVLTKVSSAKQAIGYAVKSEAAGSTKVRCRLLGTYESPRTGPESITFSQGTVATVSDEWLRSFPSGGVLGNLKARLGTGCDTTETVTIQLTNGTDDLGDALVLDNTTSAGWTPDTALMVGLEPDEDVYLDITHANPSTAANLDISVSYL